MAETLRQNAQGEWKLKIKHDKTGINLSIPTVFNYHGTSKQINVTDTPKEYMTGWFTDVGVAINPDEIEKSPRTYTKNYVKYNITYNFDRNNIFPYEGGDDDGGDDGGDDPIEPKTLHFAEGQKTVESGSGSYAVSLQSNTTWAISVPSNSFVTVNQADMSGESTKTVHLSYGANSDTTQSRNTTITARTTDGSNLTSTFKLIQKQAESVVPPGPVVTPVLRIEFDENRSDNISQSSAPGRAYFNVTAENVTVTGYTLDGFLIFVSSSATELIVDYPGNNDEFNTRNYIATVNGLVNADSTQIDDSVTITICKDNNSTFYLESANDPQADMSSIALDADVTQYQFKVIYENVNSIGYDSANSKKITSRNINLPYATANFAANTSTAQTNSGIKFVLTGKTSGGRTVTTEANLWQRKAETILFVASNKQTPITYLAEFSSVGGTATAYVRSSSDSPWSINYPSNGFVTRVNPSNGGAGDTQITITYSANEGATRSAVLTAATQNGKATATLGLSQSQAVAPDPEPEMVKLYVDNVIDDYFEATIETIGDPQHESQSNITVKANGEVVHIKSISHIDRYTEVKREIELPKNTVVTLTAIDSDGGFNDYEETFTITEDTHKTITMVSVKTAVTFNVKYSTNTENAGNLAGQTVTTYSYDINCTNNKPTTVNRVNKDIVTSTGEEEMVSFEVPVNSKITYTIQKSGGSGVVYKPSDFTEGIEGHGKVVTANDSEINVELYKKASISLSLRNVCTNTQDACRSGDSNRRLVYTCCDNLFASDTGDTWVVASNGRVYLFVGYEYNFKNNGNTMAELYEPIDVTIKVEDGVGSIIVDATPIGGCEDPNTGDGDDPTPGGGDDPDPSGGGDDPDPGSGSGGGGGGGETGGDPGDNPGNDNNPNDGHENEGGGGGSEGGDDDEDHDIENP